MNNSKHWIPLALMTASLFFFTACPGGESGDTEASQSPPVSEITEESALEDADKILEEIENL